MTQRPRIAVAGGRLAVALTLFLVVQAVAAVFFIGDALADLAEGAVGLHGWVEGMVALALAGGLVLGAVALREALARIRRQEAALAAAAGDLARVIAGQFDAWGLTPAERDVGMLALKGLDVAEIATLRGAAQGTVRAQLTRIYAKAGVSGRAQFAAWFVEDLLDTPDPPPTR